MLVCVWDQGYRFVGEKVVHHPTVFSLYCQGSGWEVAADTDLKSKFWGSSIELRPIGVILLKTYDGETYKLNKVSQSSHHNIHHDSRSRSPPPSIT